MDAPAKLAGLTSDPELSLESVIADDGQWVLANYRTSLRSTVPVLVGPTAVHPQTAGTSAAATDQVRDLQALQILSAHPAMLEISATGLSQSRPYIVFEQATAVQPGSYSLATALSATLMCAGAIATAHAGGVLHRLITPANLYTGNYGWAQLGPGAITVAAGAGGAPLVHESWTAPEEAGHSISPAVDVYGLAQICQWLLGMDNAAWQSDASVPAQLRETVNQALSVQPQARPQLSDFISALQRVQLSLGISVTACDVDAGIVHRLRNLTGRREPLSELSGLWRDADGQERTVLSAHNQDATTWVELESDATVFSERAADKTVISDARGDSTRIVRRARVAQPGAAQSAAGAGNTGVDNTGEDNTVSSEPERAGTVRYQIRKIEVPVVDRIATAQRTAFVAPVDDSTQVAKKAKHRAGKVVAFLAVALGLVVVAGIGIVLLIT